ncbi:MAG: hypothetical protein HY364_02340 [Candidatus Aenigmarchaeota archaeon]|nr:hypothetical protein [Candidatus Aenigmarchaeota archaeon]
MYCESGALEIGLKALWLQTLDNGKISPFGQFYQDAVMNRRYSYLPDGRLTIIKNGAADPAYVPVHMNNLRNPSEDEYTFSRRMEAEYPWEMLAAYVGEKGRPLLAAEIMAKHEVLGGQHRDSGYFTSYDPLWRTNTGTRLEMRKN